MSSYERRLQRLIDNEDLDVAACWERFLQHTLPFRDSRRAILVLDGTPYNQTFTIVFVGILVQKRLWRGKSCLRPRSGTRANGRSSIVSQAQVATFLPARHVTVLADRGLTALPLIRLCQRYQWHYLLRIQNDEDCRRSFRKGSRDWQRGCDFLLKAGTSW